MLKTKCNSRTSTSIKQTFSKNKMENKAKFRLTQAVGLKRQKGINSKLRIKKSKLTRLMSLSLVVKPFRKLSKSEEAKTATNP